MPKRITGHLEEKNGKWYAAVNHYDAEGKRKVKWHSLDLEAKKGTKKEAEARLNKLLDKFNTGDLYLQEAMTHAERERNRLANTLVEDYLPEWLEGHRGNITASTYKSYLAYIENRIAPFFRELHLTVKDVTGDEINEFYNTLRADGLKGTSCQRYHALLHEAFKHAMKEKQEEMKRVMKGGYCHDYDDYVNVDVIGRLYDPDYVSSHFDVILKNHGLRKIRFHDLRHSCASILVANGVPMKMVQEFMGHSDMATTANIYSHIDAQSKLATAAVITSALAMDDE